MKELEHLLLLDKFAKGVWLERGLNPSSQSLCISLQTELNFTISGALKFSSDCTSTDKTIFFKNALSKFDKYQLDTEERELVVDYFSEISELSNVDINDILDFWLYGLNNNQDFKPKSIRVLETITNKCSKCQQSLIIDIIRKRNNISGLWEITQCKNCEEFNLLEIPENTDVFRNRNFSFLKS
jgi:Domain of unknown function (DUF4844)